MHPDSIGSWLRLGAFLLSFDLQQSANPDTGLEQLLRTEHHHRHQVSPLEQIEVLKQVAVPLL